MNVSALTLTPSKTQWRWRVGWALLMLGAIGAAVNAVVFISVPEYGNPAIQSRFTATALAGFAHTMGGAVAVLIGPFQLCARGLHGVAAGVDGGHDATQCLVPEARQARYVHGVDAPAHRAAEKLRTLRWPEW